MKQGENECTQE